MLGSIQLGDSTSSDNSALNGKVGRRNAIRHCPRSLLGGFIGGTSNNQSGNDLISRLSKNREPIILIQDDTLETEDIGLELICQDLHTVSLSHIHSPRQELEFLGGSSQHSYLLRC